MTFTTGIYSKKTGTLNFECPNCFLKEKLAVPKPMPRLSRTHRLCTRCWKVLEIQVERVMP